MSNRLGVSAIESVHERTAFGESEIDELESGADRKTFEQTENAISGHLVRLIDVFFGLVAAQGILRFDDVVRDPLHSSAPALLALLVVYYTVIRSFVAWHSAIEQWRYRILVPNVRTTELWRVYVDIAIVVVYAFLLLAAYPLVKDPGAEILGFFVGFPLLFVLYGLWGRLRKIAWGGGSDPFDVQVLAGFGIAFALVAIVYAKGPDLGFSDETGNTIGIVTTGALMMFYRLINFWQGPLYEGKSRWHRIPVPAVPKLRVTDQPVLRPWFGQSESNGQKVD